ncbi:MAG: antibiotic biosynthesis monooxygenase [Desulfovibrio sp.]|nr:antibiotic biosynthesis monooxygenase [Desulfovibrio sp.]
MSMTCKPVIAILATLGALFAGKPAFAAESAAGIDPAAMAIKEQMGEDGIVRLSKIEVYPEYLDEYLKRAAKVGEISLREEPGVLTMYAVQDKANPNLVTILETYSSQDAYKKHIASPHFQEYKQGTLKMVKNLELLDQRPLNPANKLNNYIENGARK